MPLSCCRLWPLPWKDGNTIHDANTDDSFSNHNTHDMSNNNSKENKRANSDNGRNDDGNNRSNGSGASDTSPPQVRGPPELTEDEEMDAALQASLRTYEEERGMKPDQDPDAKLEPGFQDDDRHTGLTDSFRGGATFVPVVPAQRQQWQQQGAGNAGQGGRRCSSDASPLQQPDWSFNGPTYVDTDKGDNEVKPFVHLDASVAGGESCITVGVSNSDRCEPTKVTQQQQCCYNTLQAALTFIAGHTQAA